MVVCVIVCVCARCFYLICVFFLLLVVLKRTSDAAVAADRSEMSLVVVTSSSFTFVWVFEAHLVGTFRLFRAY